MVIYPAVDIKGGKCVRLRRGVASDATVYYEDPLEAAKFFADSGSRHVHVVDLDGAFEGRSVNLKIVERIAGLGMFVELGGGMRDRAAVEAAFSAGAGRAIVGTKACSEPEFAISLAADFGDKIAVGIDARGGMVAVKGWVEVTQISAVSLAERLSKGGVGMFIYTDIDTDGMLSGVNIPAQKAMLKAIEANGAKLIASGGVASGADIEKLLDLSKEHNNLEGAIVGKAIYEGRINLASAIKMASGEIV